MHDYYSSAEVLVVQVRVSSSHRQYLVGVEWGK